jgi:hypothetical protein
MEDGYEVFETNQADQLPESQESMALLKLLALGTRQIEDGKVQRIIRQTPKFDV